MEGVSGVRGVNGGLGEERSQGGVPAVGQSREHHVDRAAVHIPSSDRPRGRTLAGDQSFHLPSEIPFRALPTETQVESGTSQSKSGTSVNLSNDGESIVRRPEVGFRP